MVERRNELPESHRIDHNIFYMRSPLGRNGAEIIRVGSSAQRVFSPSHTVIENNYFIDTDGESEIISIKASETVVSGNVFVNSSGTVTLRHGNGSFVQNNLFASTDGSHQGGVRVTGERHTVSGNYFINASYGINLHEGSDDLNNNGSYDYVAAKNVNIESNAIVNIKKGIIFGGRVNSSGSITSTTPPESISIDYNVAHNNTLSNSFINEDNDGGSPNILDLSFSENLYSTNTSLGISPQNGISPSSELTRNDGSCGLPRLYYDYGLAKKVVTGAPVSISAVGPQSWQAFPQDPLSNNGSDIDFSCFQGASMVINSPIYSRLNSAMLSSPISTGNFTEYSILKGDFNGDGIDDIALTRGVNGNGIRVYMAAGTSNGQFSSSIWTAPRTSGNFANYVSRSGDFDGDGVEDIVWIYQSGSGGLRAYVSLGNSNGQFSNAVWNAPASNGDFTDYIPLIGDFNGDGRSDIAWTHGSGSNGLVVYVSSGLSNGRLSDVVYSTPRTSGDFDTYTPLKGDFNGDGIVDIAWAGEIDGQGFRGYVAKGNSNGRFSTATWSAPRTSGNFKAYSPRSGDFNGDGISDIAWVYQSPENGLRVYLSQGSNGTLSTAVWSSPKNIGDFSQHYLLSGDVNGDGSDDFMWTDSSSRAGLWVHTALSKENNRFTKALTNAPRLSGSFFSHTPLAGDFNGDGHADLVWVGRSNSGGFHIYSALTANEN